MTALLRTLRFVAEIRRRYFALDLGTICWLMMIAGLFFVVVLSATSQYRML